MKNNAMLSIGTLMNNSNTPQKDDMAKTSSVKFFLPRGATRKDSAIIRTVDTPEYNIVAYRAFGWMVPVQSVDSWKIINL